MTGQDQAALAARDPNPEQGVLAALAAGVLLALLLRLIGGRRRSGSGSR